jgi:hypothetical protein
MTNIIIADVRFLMSKGYTRTPEDAAYSPAIGSIAEHYNISNDQVKLLFRDPRMKGIRTRKQPTPQFVLLDGDATITEVPQNTTTIPETATVTTESTSTNEHATTSVAETVNEVEFETIDN